ncbi:MAG: hypothetical protein PHE55_10695 [Methylococcaceae bacterium]|nr:hypothetical protein [Methylococcaceae bacterium]
MSTRLALIAGLLWSVFALAEPADYRFSRPVEWSGEGDAEMLAAPLDSLIYADTRQGFPDLRIVDQAGTETPYLLEKAVETRTETTRLACKSEVVSLQKRGEEGIELFLRLDRDAPAADGLTVFTPLSNYEYRMQVFGSDDGKNWLLLVKDAAIFDYSRYMAIGNRDIPLPTNRYRQFKVVIEEAIQTHEAEVMELNRHLREGKEIDRGERLEVQKVPLHIDRIELWRNQSEVLPQAEKKFQYPVAGFKIVEDAKNHWTVIEVNTHQEPLTGFALQTSTANFTRPVSVQIAVPQGIETRMREIGNATVQALHFREFQREENVIAFPEQRQESYRIVIRNEDNPPLEITGIMGLGNGYRLVFLPTAGKTYRVHYGSQQAVHPNYDTSSIRELLRRGYQAREVGLGVASTAELAQSWDLAKLLNSRSFLIAMVTLMVLVLAWSLVRAGKRIGQFPQE